MNSATNQGPRSPFGHFFVKAIAKAVHVEFLALTKGRKRANPQSRSMTSVHGTFNGVAFQATLEPDGQGGHWLKVDRKMREAGAGGAPPGRHAGNRARWQGGTPVCRRSAEGSRGSRRGLRKVWSSITPMARRDWIHWIVSAKQAETRARQLSCLRHGYNRQRQATSVLLRSGMYDKSLRCPVADDTSK